LDHNAAAAAMPRRFFVADHFDAEVLLLSRATATARAVTCTCAVKFSTSPSIHGVAGIQTNDA
jgi:hypothetical protein